MLSDKYFKQRKCILHYMSHLGKTPRSAIINWKYHFCNKNRSKHSTFFFSTKSKQRFHFILCWKLAPEYV